MRRHISLVSQCACTNPRDQRIQELNDTKKFKPNPKSQIHHPHIHNSTNPIQSHKIHHPYTTYTQITAILDLTDHRTPPSDSATTPHHPAVHRRGEVWRRGRGARGQKKRGAVARRGGEQWPGVKESSAEKGGDGQSPERRVTVPECEQPSTVADRVGEQEG